MFFQENISISRKQFKDSVTELNPFVSPVGLHAIIYEYTWWMDPSNKSALIDAIDKMVGDYQFTCPVQEFAQRYGQKKLLPNLVKAVLSWAVHSGPENVKKSRPKNWRNQINQFRGKIF